MEFRKIVLSTFLFIVGAVIVVVFLDGPFVFDSYQYQYRSNEEEKMIKKNNLDRTESPRLRENNKGISLIDDISNSDNSNSSDSSDISSSSVTISSDSDKPEDTTNSTTTLVVELTSDNFNAWMRDNNVAFVLFYAPWSPSCRRMVPVWETFAVTVAAKEALGQQLPPNMGVAKVDCSNDWTFGFCENIDTLPTLLWFEKGQPVLPPYKSGRNIEGMVEFAKQKLALSNRKHQDQNKNQNHDDNQDHKDEAEANDEIIDNK